MQILVQVQMERTLAELKRVQKVQRRLDVVGFGGEELGADRDKGSRVRKWTGWGFRRKLVGGGS